MIEFVAAVAAGIAAVAPVMKNLGEIAKGSDVDVNVIALIGERGWRWLAACVAIDAGRIDKQRSVYVFQHAQAPIGHAFRIARLEIS